MNKITTIFIFILSCSANNQNLLPQDFRANYRADKTNTLQLFINDVKSSCKDKEVKSECQNYFPLDTLNNLLNRYKSTQPQVNSYEKYYQLKQNIHQELLSVVNQNRKKNKQRSQKEIVITNLSGQCLAASRKFQDQDDNLQVVQRKVQEFKEKEAADNRRQIEQTQEDSQQKTESQNQTQSEQSSSSDEQEVQQIKQVKRRRIVVLDILECEDCMKKGYINMF